MTETISKTDSEKAVRDAGETMVRTGGDAASTRKAARDASQASGESVHKVMAATDRDVVRKNTRIAEQNLQKAAEELHDAVERSAETLGNVAGATDEVTGQAAAQHGQMLAMQDRAFKEVAGRTQQNLGVMMQTGIKLADGFQTVMREWADYTRQAMQCNIDGMNSILRARTPHDLMAAQSDLLNAEMRVMLNSSIKIAEATARVAKEASQSISERTHRNQ